MQDAGPSLIVADGTLPKLAFQLSNDAWHTPPELWLYGLAALLLIALGWWLTRRLGPVLRSLLRAGLVAFLLSPASSWVNGVNIACDGGFSNARAMAPAPHAPSVLTISSEGGSCN